MKSSTPPSTPPSTRHRILLLVVLAALAAVLHMAWRPPPGASPKEQPLAVDCASDAAAWRVRVGTDGGDVLVRGRQVDRLRGDLDALVGALNRSAESAEALLARTPDLERPLFKLEGQRGDTVQVRVLNPERLASRLGSTGAQATLAEATYTLTEHPGIRNVDFLFPEGDHAAPGIYARDDFSAAWKIVQAP